MRLNRIASALVVFAAGAAAGTVFGPALRARFSERPSVSVAELWGHRENWQGRAVRVTGTLEKFADAQTGGSYYVIDDAGYRLGVSGLSDAEAEALLGRTVHASGLFGFSEKGGGFLKLGSISAAP